MVTIRCFENSLQLPTIEEVDLEQLEHLLKAEAYAGFEFEPGQDEIGDHGHVDLAQDGVFRVADKGFEPQVLLDEPKEGLDLPALLVDVGDGLCREVEMVGQELVELSGFRVAVADAAKPELLAPEGDADHMVRSHARAFPDRASLEHLVHGVGLEPSDKEQARCSQRPEPGVVDVVLVENRDGTLGKLEHLDHLGVVQSSLGDPHEGRQIAVMVENHVKFHPASFGAKVGPWIGRQAEFYDRGVKAEKFGLEAKLMTRGHGCASLIHFAEKRLEKIGRTLGVGVCEGRTSHGAQAQMVESSHVCSQTAYAVAHAPATSQVNEEQTSELIPSRKCPRTPASTVFPGQGLEFMSGNQG